MEVIFIILPLAVLMAAVASAAFYWGVHGGQFDDLDTPRYRALFDDFPKPHCSDTQEPTAGRQRR